MDSPNPMNKAILIFGAGINQLELIREAHKIGIVTVVIDPTFDPPGKSEADFYYQVDGKDYDTTNAIAIKHKVDGIVTGQMEKPMRLMARLADDLGYIFHSPEVVERSLNKWLMKQAFLKNDVPCAKAILLSKNDEMTREKLDGLKFPLIIKPKDAFSSRGVYKVNSYNEIIVHLDESRSFASDGDILIEEFLEGKEFSIESITFSGKTTVVQVTEKFITPFPNTVEMGHLQPAPVDKIQWEQISKTVKQAIRAIGIDNSASHAEVMLSTDGVKMIEIGARLGGDFIASYLTRSSTGISMDKASVQVALGMEPDLKRKLDRFSYIKYIELPLNKKVIKIFPVDDIINQPDVVLVHFFVKSGDSIKQVTHSALRPACIIVEGTKREYVIEMAESYADIIKQRIVLS